MFFNGREKKSKEQKTWSQSYDRELQRQHCKKFTTPRVA
jgi:hypothetical protein